MAEKPLNNTEEIIEPKMRFDAFMANVKDGGLRSVSSIYMLVCYIVANLNGRVSASTIIEAVDGAMIANYFEISDAVAKLIKAGTIMQGDDGMLSMDSRDIPEVELIEQELPLTIRQRSIKACQKVIARETYKRDNKVIIEKIDGGYKVNLKVSDSVTDFMNLELFAVNLSQAEMIRDKFISDPAAVYEKLIDYIFSN